MKVIFCWRGYFEGGFVFHSSKECAQAYHLLHLVEAQRDGVFFITHYMLKSGIALCAEEWHIRVGAW